MLTPHEHGLLDRLALRRVSTIFGITLFVGLVAGARPAHGAEAELLLEVYEEARPGFVPEAAPLRFGLWRDGQILVGGASKLRGGRLEKAELEPLLRRIKGVRQLGLGTLVQFPAGPRRYWLQLPHAGREYLISGDLAGAPPELRPLAQLLADLSAFEHASLRSVSPAGLWVSAIEQTLPGGCRPWTLGVPLSKVSAGPRLVAVKEAADWAIGATATSVCEGDRRYPVTFRPMALNPTAARREFRWEEYQRGSFEWYVHQNQNGAYGDHNNDYAYERPEPSVSQE